MEKRNRIYYITSLFPVLTQTFVSREIIEMERRGVTIDIISLKNNPQSVGKEEMPNARILYFPYFFSLRVWWFALLTLFKHHVRVVAAKCFIVSRLRRRPLRILKFMAVLPKTLFLIEYLSRARAGHLHAHWATVPTTCALFIHRVTGMSFSFSAHAWDIFVAGNELLLPEKLAAAERVFTCTRYNHGALVSLGGKPETVQLMYHGFEPSRYPYCEPGVSDVPLIVAGGSLVPQKGLDYLVTALSHLDRDGVRFRALIFGEGSERARLDAMVKQFGLESKIDFIGILPHREVVTLLGSADMFVMPSISAKNRFIDGLPNVVAEAMACGAVVIASRLSGIPELIEDGVEGKLVPSEDSEAIAEALKELAAHPDRMRDIARCARARVEAQFDVRTNIEPLYGYLSKKATPSPDMTAGGDAPCAE
jgi:colanic acid/amylovoran biosynthesis glycosyltransferase